MTMKKWISTLWLLCLLGVVVHAQREGLPQQGRIAERVEAMKVAFITQRLSLTTQEAQLFWPLYNEYEAEQSKIRQRYRLSDNFAGMTDAEAEKALDDALEMEQQLLNLKRDYTQRMRKILPVRKVAMLNRVEREFREELVKQIREMQMNRQQRRFNGRND